MIAILIAIALQAQMPNGVVNPGSPVGATLTNGEITTSNGFGGHYEASSPNRIVIDTSYFAAVGNTISRYVNTTSGDDSLCDGLASTTGTTKPCAWKTVQRALDDIPNGYTAGVNILLAAETLTPAAQTWVFHSIPANNAPVRVQGDCSTPQATFTTTGTGTFSTTSAGSGKTGGVTSVAQVSFTPTVATGSLPATIADADFWFRTTSALGVATVLPVMASTGTSMVLNRTTTTAIATLSPTLCPWSTVVSGALTVKSTVMSGFFLNPIFSVAGIKATSSINILNATVAGIYETGSTVTLSNAASNGNYFAPTSISQNCSSQPSVCGWAQTVVSGATLQPQGQMSVSGLVLKGSQSWKLVLGSSGSGLANTYGNANVTSFSTTDFEGTGTAIRLLGPIVFGTGNAATANGPITCGSTVAFSMDITGSPLQMDAGAQFVGCGSMTGKYTAASSVRADADVWLPGTWSPVNVSSSTQEWTIGASGTKQASDLPWTDSEENCTVSNAGYSSTSGTVNVAGPLRLSGTTTGGKLTLDNTIQLSERMRLSGQEYYQSGHTDTEGLSLLLWVNRASNRQAAWGFSDQLAVNATNPILRFFPTVIDSVATDGSTPLALSISGSPLALNTGGAATTVGGTLGVTGATTLGATTATTYSTVTNCSDSAGAAACGSASAGMFVLDAAATTVVVSTTAVTANSEIDVWQDQSEGTRLSVTCNTSNVRQYKVTARTAGTSFTVGAFDFVTGAALGPVNNPDCMSYAITN